MHSERPPQEAGMPTRAGTSALAATQAARGTSALAATQAVRGTSALAATATQAATQ